MISELRAIGIDVNPGMTGKVKVKCPNCTPHDRKPKNRNAKDLSVDVETGLYKCHNCGWKGGVGEPDQDAFRQKQVVYSLPDPNELIKMSNEAEAYLIGRGISRRVITENGISMNKYNSIVFPYYMDGTLVNTKVRSITKKQFRQAGGARPIVYNYDRAFEALKSMPEGKRWLILCEGEIDNLSWEEAGFVNCVSVNQGAPNKTDSNYDNKLKCIDESMEIFEFADQIILAGDNDDNGREMNGYIVRRFGAEKCRSIDFENYKDANDVFDQMVTEAQAIDKLQRIYESSREIQIDGVFYLNDVMDQMFYNFRNGKQRGSTTHTPIDDAWTWMPGELNMWTGYNNEGKSKMIKYLAILKAWYDKWNYGFFSPEDMPIGEFFDDLIEILIGKSCDLYYKNDPLVELMTEQEYAWGMNFIMEHFFVIYPSDNFGIDNLFEKAKYLIRKKNIKALVIDPYNWVEHKMKPGEREDLYISRFMTELGNFTKQRNLSTHLVAHQTTPSKNSDGLYPCPSKYNIKGGGTFSDKSDNVLGTWRPKMAQNPADTEVVFFSEKIKKQKLVGTPQRIGDEYLGCDIRFNPAKNRYTFDGFDPFESIDTIRNNELGIIPKKKKQEPVPSIQPNFAFEEEEDDDTLPF